MAKQDPLPERLQYLQPYREFLAKIPKSKLDEGTDTTLLDELVRERIRENTETEAKEKLSADLEELEKYLSTRLDDKFHFVRGFFLIAVENPMELLKSDKKPEERLLMELPPNAKAKYEEEWALVIKWKRQLFCGTPLDMSDNWSRELFLAEFNNPNANQYEIFKIAGYPTLAEMFQPEQREMRPPPSIAVSFGKVVGHKQTISHESKKVSYKLQIPGGYAKVSIYAGFLFDESKWDSYLATLRYEKPIVK